MAYDPKEEYGEDAFIIDPRESHLQDLGFFRGTKIESHKRFKVSYLKNSEGSKLPIWETTCHRIGKNNPGLKFYFWFLKSFGICALTLVFLSLPLLYT